MARRPFAVQPGGRALARIAMLPVQDARDVSPAADPLITEGTFLASRQVGALATQAGPLAGPGRLAATLRGYEIRARYRPTPHGVFAGVAWARFAREAASLEMGRDHRPRTNPSPGWLAAVCDTTLADPGVLPRLTLHASNLTVRRGHRIEQEQQSVPGEAGPRRITVRATDATCLIMRVCAAGATITEILGAVTRRWPAAPEAMVTDAALGLVRSGFLLTDLLPADISADPIGHLLGRLPDASQLRGPLGSLRRLLAEADRYPPGHPARLTALIRGRDVADEICLQDRPLVADVAASASLVLPAVLAEDAAAATGVLWQVSPARDPLTAWHGRFLDRYGPHRLVPLLDAVDAATGLGTGAGAETDEPLPSPRRAATLAALLARAAADGSTEVTLDPAAIAGLADGLAEGEPPRTAEVYVRVVAGTEQDLAAGRLRLAISPAAGSQDAGSTSGRLAALLPGPPAAPVARSSALVAELVVRPRTCQAAALAPPTGFAPWRIPVGVRAEEGDLSPEDLLLVSDGDQLMAWSASQGREVIPVLYSRLAPGLLPPLARFLQLVGHSGTRPWHGWSWGPLSHVPFQPRVRYGRTVLAPARWVLPAELTDAAGDQETWGGQLDAWRTAARPPPPDVVITDDGDRRLPLDLRRQPDRELLRRYVRRGLAAVTEQPGGAGAVQDVVCGPGGRHVLEVVIPLVRNTAAAAAADPARPAAAAARAAGKGLYLPGGEWLSLAVRSPAICHEQVVLSLAAVADGLAGRWDQWFWLRYHDPARGPQVRARFHGDPAVLGGQVLPALSAWGSGLIGQRLSGGFSVEPYDQEIERYGGPGSICAAERVFAADSHLALTVLAATRDPDQRLLTSALSAAAIAGTVAGGDPAALREHHVDRAGRERMAVLRPQVRSAGRDGTGVVPAAVPAWTARQDALAAYRDTLAPGQRSPAASALIHLHANRLLGRAETECVARALAADLLARPA